MPKPLPIPRWMARPWFDRRLFVIYPANRPDDAYMLSWTLLSTRWGKLKLHKFLRPDNDFCSLHDHPRSFVTLILAGGYRETMPHGVRWRSPGTLLYRPATFRHRVDVPHGRPCWTLLWFRNVTRRWGFWTRLGFTPFRPGMTPVCEEVRS